MNHHRVTFKQSVEDWLFDISVYAILMLGLIMVAYPLIIIVSSSFSSPQALVSGKVWLLPVEPTLMAYKAVFKNNQIAYGYLNSLIYTLSGTLINVLLTVLAAYPLSRKDFFGGKIIIGLFVFTMLFSGGLIPSYLVVYKLGLINNRLAMILPGAMSVWNVILTLTFIKSTIPEELHESAKLDGCSIYRILWVIVVPLSSPILAVVALYCAVGSWNSYFDAFLYLTKKELFPLQIVLRNILILNQVDPSMVVDVRVLSRKQGLTNLLKYAVIIVSSVPLLLFYPFIQKYFVKGIMIGSLKG